MGLAIGAGFYECVLLGFLLILLTNRLLPFVEDAIIESARNMNIYVEFQTLDNLGDIIARIKSQGGQIYEVDLDRVRCGCVLEAVSGHLLHPQPVFHRRQRKAGLHLHGGVRSLPVR